VELQDEAAQLFK